MISFRIALLLLVTFSAACGVARAYDATQMVVATEGALPLLLTVPHDGDVLLGSTALRTPGNRPQDKVTRDFGTRKLAEQIAEQLNARLGRRPYLVIARVSRNYLDVNRVQQDAMRSPDALPAYLAYHDRIAGYVDALRQQFPAGALLVDIHGQSDEPNIIFRGTRAGLTTASLIKRFGPDAIDGQHSIFGALAAKGYQIHPVARDRSLREDPRFDGGYTVATYGSHHPQGIDAIQIEFGKHLRGNPGLATDVADGLISFMRHYRLLPP